MLETFQLSNKALFSQAEFRHIIIILGFWWFEELCITGNLPVWGLIEWQGANVGPCETPTLPDTQPGAAHLHHEYRGQKHRGGAWLISPSSNGWEKLAENLRQFATVWMGLVIPGWCGCVLRWLAGPRLWPPACHYHKPSHSGITRNTEAKERELPSTGLWNIYCLHFTTSNFLNFGLLSFWWKLNWCSDRAYSWSTGYLK